MTEIREVAAWAVYDSNGLPAVEVEILAEGGLAAAEAAPRGSTTGMFEAHVLEDEDQLPDLAAVAPALARVREEVGPALIGADVTDQRGIDAALHRLDGGEFFRRIGGNVSVAVSMAAARVGALATGRPLHRHLAEVAGCAADRLPAPMFNIADGAVGSMTVYTEFLLMPTTADPVEALEQGARARIALVERLRANGVRCAESTQGGWSLDLGDCVRTLTEITAAVERTGLEPGRDFTLGLDLSGAEFFDEAAGRYTFPWLAAPVAADELVDLYRTWTKALPLTFLEDAFAPQDEPAWRLLRDALGGSADVVGDDLFASSAARIVRGAKEGLADGALVKPNQTGTVTDALDALEAARVHGLRAVVSQRSGENAGTVITHLAVAGAADWLKAGGLGRMDRVAKYNELMRIARDRDTARARSRSVPTAAGRS